MPHILASSQHWSVMSLVTNTNIRTLIRSEGRPRKQKFMLQNCYEFRRSIHFDFVSRIIRLPFTVVRHSIVPGCLNSGANCSLRSAVREHLLAMENSSTARLQQRPKRTTSVRLENLERLERVVREFGFKDRSHFFQLCTDALIRAHSESQQLDWPPRFAARKEQDRRE
jgi:hypothetical protein